MENKYIKTTGLCLSLITILHQITIDIATCKSFYWYPEGSYIEISPLSLFHSSLEIFTVPFEQQCNLANVAWKSPNIQETPPDPNLLA